MDHQDYYGLLEWREYAVDIPSGVWTQFVQENPARVYLEYDYFIDATATNGWAEMVAPGATPPDGAGGLTYRGLGRKYTFPIDGPIVCLPRYATPLTLAAATKLYVLEGIITARPCSQADATNPYPAARAESPFDFASVLDKMGIELPGNVTKETAFNGPIQP